VAKWVAPSSTPYASSFPDANICVQIMDTTGTTALAYDYDRVSYSRLETIANNVSSNPSTATIYTNYETNLAFPFNYGNIVVDTFQKPSGSANTVQLTYDGYGTLVTPYGTFTNVVRIYRYWGPNDYGYSWWILNPLANVGSYDNTSRQFICATLGTSTGVKDAGAVSTGVEVFPNPAGNQFHIRISGLSDLSMVDLVITNVVGEVVKTAPLHSEETTVSKDDLRSGVYFYQVRNNHEVVATGKLILQ
jgi:hypothetical protein